MANKVKKFSEETQKDVIKIIKKAQKKRQTWLQKLLSKRKK